jgi:hypothetical protein
MAETGQPFPVALAATRAGNLFTTHTAVTAGFDLFSPSLMEQYLGRYALEKLGLGLREFLALGRQNPDDGDEPFNMAILAMRGSGAVNGVSYSIALACNNSAVLRVVDELMDLLRETREHSLQGKGRQESSLAGHRRILAALKRRNPAAAEVAMRRHLQEIENIALKKL